MCHILIGERILEYRHKNGITQQKFGEMLGVTSQAVSKWERHVCCPDISLLPELSEVLGVELRELFG